MPLAAAQSDVASQLNSIISSYSNNPAMLSSLQETISNTLTQQMGFGAPLNQPIPNAVSFKPTANYSGQTQPTGTSSQGQVGGVPAGTEMVSNVMRFLQGAQVQQPSGPPPQAGSQAPNLQMPLQYAQASVQPMLHHRTDLMNPSRNDTNGHFGNTQPTVTDTAGTTTGTSTDASASSQSQNKRATDSNHVRKRQRSSS